MTDTLQELLDAQSELQEAMPTLHPKTLADRLRANPDGEVPASAVTEFLKWNVYALEDELHELLAETGWKPWATRRFVNLEAARGEAIDALHFLLNIFLVLNMDGRAVRERYHAKHAKNAARQARGYDGVEGKCPGCHRALDDDGVACYRGAVREPGTGRLVTGSFCAARGRVYVDAQ